MKTKVELFQELSERTNEIELGTMFAYGYDKDQHFLCISIYDKDSYFAIPEGFEANATLSWKEEMSGMKSRPVLTIRRKREFAEFADPNGEFNFKSKS